MDILCRVWPFSFFLEFQRFFSFLLSSSWKKHIYNTGKNESQNKELTHDPASQSVKELNQRGKKIINLLK
jgi:hypothetical protein